MIHKKMLIAKKVFTDLAQRHQKIIPNSRTKKLDKKTEKQKSQHKNRKTKTKKGNKMPLFISWCTHRERYLLINQRHTYRTSSTDILYYTFFLSFCLSSFLSFASQIKIPCGNIFKNKQNRCTSFRYLD